MFLQVAMQPEVFRITKNTEIGEDDYRLIGKYAVFAPDIELGSDTKIIVEATKPIQHWESGFEEGTFIYNTQKQALKAAAIVEEVMSNTLDRRIAARNARSNGTPTFRLDL